MRALVLMLVALTAFCAIGCHKSNPQGIGTGTNTGNGGGGTKGGLPFANSDYVGLMTELSRNYEKPIQIHFNADSTVQAYAFFYLQIGNAFGPYDTLQGKVIKVGTGDAGGPSATVYMTTTADTQVYNFTADLSGLQGGSNGLAGNQFYTQALSKVTQTPDSLNPSFWTTDTTRGNAVGDYPDIDGVIFTTYYYAGVTGGSVTEYYQNGLYLNTGPGGIPKGVPYAFGYQQIGSRVYFYGGGGDNGIFIGVPYFGVISPDGNTIWADSRSIYAALPLLGETGYGNTPIMHKRNVPPPTPTQQCLITSYLYGSEQVSITYNADQTFNESLLGSLDIKYRYNGDSMVMTTYSSGTPVGEVAVINGASGQTASIYAAVLNSDGSVSSWQNYAFTYSGQQVATAQRTSSMTNDYNNGEFEYTYSNGNLQTVTFNQQPDMTFTYDALTSQRIGDLFWIEADVDLPLTYQAAGVISPLMYPVTNKNVCTAYNTISATYKYDSDGKIISGNINGGAITYQYKCPN